ncbi:hypothetical protein E4U60_006475 [Claviceps pazoutovae]|uniref:Uncharacterized protein n=1 Tax=Claviceps pazoutovae TaxID=1649127 RepID=A0A9P7M6T5_9HYPO|nr:hypothetical protein E4U60_006475 [Claviceps pazoutovae]
MTVEGATTDDVLYPLYARATRGLVRQDDDHAFEKYKIVDKVDSEESSSTWHNKRPKKKEDVTVLQFIV